MRGIKYRSFEDTRKFVRSLGVETQQEWDDWLGTGTVAPQVRSKLFLPPIKAKIEARKVAKKLEIKTREQWIEAYRAGKIPNNIPRDLYKIYGPKRRRK